MLGQNATSHFWTKGIVTLYFFLLEVSLEVSVHVVEAL